MGAATAEQTHWRRRDKVHGWEHAYGIQHWPGRRDLGGWEFLGVVRSACRREGGRGSGARLRGGAESTEGADRGGFTDAVQAMYRLQGIVRTLYQEELCSSARLPGQATSRGS